MLIAMRKNTKVIFWAIIIILVPVFVVTFGMSGLFMPGRGGQATYGYVHGEKVTWADFSEMRGATSRALDDVFLSIQTLAYRKPECDFFRVQRDLQLAGYALYKEHMAQRMQEQSLWYGIPAAPFDPQPLDEFRKQIEGVFTDPATGEFDKARYTERLRTVGMTDEQYVAEIRDNEMAGRWLMLTCYDQQSEHGYSLRSRVVWERFVLAREAERLSIPVSDDEVFNYLRVVCPGENGTIDEEKYTLRLRNAQKARSEYEEEIRTTIRIAKLQRLILDSVKVPSPEVVEHFNERYKTARIAYHVEPFEPFLDPTALRDDEVLNWYVRRRGNVDKFWIESRRAIMYVLIEAERFKTAVTVTEDEVTGYYATHGDEFVDADGVRLPYAVCQEQVRDAVVTRKANERARADAARYFAVQSAVGLIQEATRRGYLVQQTALFGTEGPIDGLIDEDEERFRDAAFALEAGQVTRRPVPVKQGWCVLACTRVVPDVPQRQRPPEEVRGVARAEMATEKAQQLAHRSTMDEYTRVRERMESEQIGFIEACEQFGLDVVQTDFFSYDDDEIPGLENSREVILWAFQDEDAYKAFCEQRNQYMSSKRPYDPADIYVQSLGAPGSLFFHVMERRVPDEAERAHRLPVFAETEVVRLRRSLAYQEWLNTLYAEAGVQDITQQRIDEQKRLEEQQKAAAEAAQRPGPTATPQPRTR